MKFKAKKFNYLLGNRRLPTGKWVKVDVIEHPGAALIVPFLTADKIVMMRQYRAVIEKYLYELPAGTLDKGENPRECAKREIMEEINYKAGKLTKKGYIYPVPGYSTEIIYIYKAEKLTPMVKPKDEDEIITPIVMSRAQVRKIFHSGQIQDAKTICALAFCRLI